MNKLILVFILVLSHFYTQSLNAQNLIPNPSFEYYTECPTEHEQIQLAFPWKNLTLSTDYYNACNTDNFVSVPNNFGSFQHAKTGNAYGGFSIFVDDGIENFNQRDYMVTPLISNLEQDSFYLVEFYINKAGFGSNACDCFDVWLLDSIELVPPTPLFNGFIEGAAPQLHSPKGYFIQDTVNWIRLAWLYQATGVENMIAIGNFDTDENTDFITSSLSTNNSAYYYIDDVTVKKIPQNLAQINIGNDTTICDSAIVKTLTAPPIYDSYLWNTGDTSMSIDITSAGTYWVDVGVGDCIITDTIYILSRLPETETLAAYIEICPDDLPYRIIAPDSMEHYLWSDGSDSAHLDILQSGSYWVAAEYACGIWRDTIEVNILNDEPIHLGEDTVLCNQPVFSEQLVATSGYDSYLWSTGENSESITVTTPGTYSVTATSLCGQISDTIIIQNLPNQTLNLGNDTTFCKNENILLQVNPEFETYLWNTGDSENNIIIEDYGTYIIEAQNTCQTIRDTINIFPPPEIWVQLPLDTIVNLGASLVLNPLTPPSGNFTYQWQPETLVSCEECPSVEIEALQNNTFTVTITNEFGCTATAQINVNISEKRDIYIPNAFSPNGDSYNDKFTIYGGNEVASIEYLKIFNRWGAVVFEQKDLVPNDEDSGWDGVFKGKKMNTGVYVVLAIVTFKDGKTESFAQDLILME